jgi:hypothetical protein
MAYNVGANNVGAYNVGANNVGANNMGSYIVVGPNILGENVFTTAAVETEKKTYTKKYENLPGAILYKPIAKNDTLCGCYKANSTDARCCGLCYCCCPAKDIDKYKDLQRCDFCPNDFCEYWYSGYVQTTSGYGNQEEDINGVCCWLCFPVKLPMFFPCLLGSLCNQVINACCAATTSPTLFGICSAPNKRNYLC